MRGALYLIDGYSVIYRGYFAFLRRPLLNPQGRNASSVFVFFRSLLELVRSRSPGGLAVAMDSRTPTFRHVRYPEYKATREKAPDDLHAQVPVIEEILAALGIACVRADGFEADDVIATLAEQCRATARPCWILSGDKDILQLIGGNVRLLAQERGSAELAEYSREKVFEARGVYPEQIIDYLALTGDASDNIPGVSGVGEKTAVKLLSRFGSLDAVYARLEEVSPDSLRQKLTDGRDSAFLSRELATLDRSVPGLPGLDALSFHGLNAGAAVPLFEREGMKTIVAELGPAGGAPAAGDAPAAAEAAAGTGGEADAVDTAAMPAADAVPAPVELAVTAPGTYTTVTDAAELDRWISGARAAGEFSFDVETDGTDEMRAVPLGFSLSYREGSACYIPVRAAGVSPLPEAAVREKLRSLLTDPGLRMIGQNAKYDYKVMARWGVRPTNLRFDTMVAAWVLESDQSSYGLDRLAEKHLHYRTLPYEELVGRKSGLTLYDIPIQKVTDYSGEDADLTLRMYRLLAPQLSAEGLQELFTTVEMPLVPVLAEMEIAGIRVLPTELASYSREMEKDLAGLEDEIYTLCGRKFNINSTRQLQEILFTWRKLTPVKKTKTGFSTDMDVLEALAAQDPVPEKILAHRKASKLKSTYVDALPLMINETTGRVHTHYVQTGTATGRLSSKDPNLQNIPIREEAGRRIRAAFVPAPGMRFVSADYAQIELAVLASLSGDPILVDSFREGRDIHRQTASLIFGTPEAEVSAEQRRVGKTINFGVIYGMSAYGLSQGLRIPKADADRFIKTYFERFQGVDAFIRQTIRAAEETGFVRTLFGRRRRITAITSRNRTEKTAAERVAVNSPIQGTAADIMKIAMVRLARSLSAAGLAARPLLQVHDEVVLEVPEKETRDVAAVLKQEMEGVTDGRIPLRVQVEEAASWGDLH
jgi:DNA polymerase I